MNPKPRFTTPTTQPRRVPEWKLQASAVSALKRQGWPILTAGDMAAGRRSPRAAALAKVTGLEAGDPDLRVMLPNGRLGQIEFKAKGGSLSAVQKARHKALAALGHEVVVIKAETEEAAVASTLAVVASWLGLPANDNTGPITAGVIVGR